MKARVKATGEIVEVNEVTKYSPNYTPQLYYEDVENGMPYKVEHLDFDLKENKIGGEIISLPNEPGYWDKLLHQYAGMMLASMLAISEWEWTYEKMSECAIEAAKVLINKLKEE